MRDSANSRTVERTSSCSGVRSKFIVGSARPESCSPAAKTKRRKDAGSARSRRLRGRLKTRRGAGLQRTGECEAGWAEPFSTQAANELADQAHAVAGAASLREVVVAWPREEARAGHVD